MKILFANNKIDNLRAEWQTQNVHAETQESRMLQ